MSVRKFRGTVCFNKSGTKVRLPLREEVSAGDKRKPLLTSLETLIDDLGNCQKQPPQEAVNWDVGTKVQVWVENRRVYVIRIEERHLEARPS